MDADHPRYDEARKVWNGMIDRRPALIAQCTGVADVRSSVKFAREHDLGVAVRGGGHNVAGTAVCDDGMVIDLSLMKGMRVDSRRCTARAQPGLLWGELDRETQTFGLACPGGIVTHTGIAGLTLGGGFGWLQRKYGLTCDNLLSADVVTADGQFLTISDTEHPDLFWGIRGGGGNFGIVTSFQFRLHPVGPQVLAGLIVHPFSDAGKVFRHYRSFVATAPDNVTSWVVLRKAPPLPFLPPEVHGKEIFVIAVLCVGDIKEAEKVLQPLRKFGQPIADVVGPSPFEGFQQAFDPLLTPGARNYWKSHNFKELSDGAIDTIIDHAGKLPTPLSEIFVGQLGGAINRVPKDNTAYPHREANFVMNVHTRWEDKGMDAMCTDWSRKFFDTMAQYADGGVYVNFISEGEDRVSSAFGGNYERLAKLKSKYDPANFFRTNQNIAPK